MCGILELSLLDNAFLFVLVLFTQNQTNKTNLHVSIKI